MMRSLGLVVLSLVVLSISGCYSLFVTHHGSANKKGVVYSLEIEPSRLSHGWILYKKGAVATLKAKNIKEAVILYYPTGTEIGEQFPNGVKLGQMTQSKEDDDIWTYSLPPGLMTTNFWVEATDLENNVLKSKDLGNVGWDDN